MKFILFISVACFTLGYTSVAGAQTRAAQYGIWTEFSETRSLKFPDFELSFLTISSGGIYPGTTRPLGEVYQFEIRSSSSKEKVLWSSGTGDISGSFFSVEGKEFVLEMRSSAALDTKIQKPNKVILWPKELWTAQAERLRIKNNEKLSR